MQVWADGRPGWVYAPRTTTQQDLPGTEKYIAATGEGMNEIARKVTGDTRNWHVIADMNPQIFYPLDLEGKEVLDVPNQELAVVLKSF